MYFVAKECKILRANKMKRKMIFLAIVYITCSAGFAGLQNPSEQGVTLTVYNNNFAVVRQSRQIAFEKGLRISHRILKPDRGPEM